MGMGDEKKKKFSSRMAILRDACQKALNHHNAHRAKHVDTPPMKLDDKLCEDAQTYAEKMAATGVFEHPQEELRRLKQGENLFMSWSSGDSGNDPVQKAAQASDGWYAEIANYDWKTGGKNGNTAIARGQIGHFTALVWQKTDKMGIGVAFKGNSCYVVARYQPQGNYIGKNLTYVKPLKDAPKIPDPPKPAPTEPVKPVEPVKETLIKPPAMKKDTLLKILPNLYKRFDIKLAFLLSEHKPTNQGWSNLIHFTCGSNCTNIGDRIPAIWFHPGQDKLHIRHCIDDNYNGGFDGSSPLKLGLTKIHISQKPDANGKWCFSAVVENNGQKKMYKCCQGTARDFQMVKVYASDPWYDPADNAKILSLEVQTEPEKTLTTAMTHTAKYKTYGEKFSVHCGYIVNAISVNGKKYGQNGGGERRIKLAPGEKIIKGTYGLTPYKEKRDRLTQLTCKQAMCLLTFYSSKKKKYGPYGNLLLPLSRYNWIRTDCKGITEVKNLPSDWSKTIIVNTFPVGFSGASVSFSYPQRN